MATSTDVRVDLVVIVPSVIEELLPG